MKALLPDPAGEVDLVEAYALPAGTGNRPFVRCNMISTLDGAITIEGRSGLLGGPADRSVFQVLRSLADVVLVGAGTARAEGYGPVTLDDQLRYDAAMFNGTRMVASRFENMTSAQVGIASMPRELPVTRATRPSSALTPAPRARRS